MQIAIFMQISATECHNRFCIQFHELNYRVHNSDCCEPDCQADRPNTALAVPLHWLYMECQLALVSVSVVLVLNTLDMLV